MTKTEMSNEKLEKAVQLCVERFFGKKFETSAETFSRKIIEYNKSKTQSYEYEHYYPTKIFWKIISECNLRCSHCFFYGKEDKFNSKNDLSKEKIMQVIDELEEMNVLSIILTGGEVFLRNDIFEILSKLKSKNISIKISTNATLITKEMAKKLAAILNPIMDNVQVSLDGATSETHDKTRGKGAFDKAIQGVKNLVEYGIFPIVNCTVTSMNVSEMKQLYNLTQNLKVKKLSLTKIAPCAEDQNNLVPDLDNLFEALAEVIKLESQGEGPFLDMRIFAVHDFANHKIAQKFLTKYLDAANKLQMGLNKNCMCHKNNKAYIDADGSLYLCNIAAEIEKCSFGNIRDSSFIDVWATRLQNIFFKERNASDMACINCKYINVCSGGCPANAYNGYGDVKAPDKNCQCGRLLMQAKV